MFSTDHLEPPNMNVTLLMGLILAYVTKSPAIDYYCLSQQQKVRGKLQLCTNRKQLKLIYMIMNNQRYLLLFTKGIFT